ncbi:MAG: NAD(P)-dependent oxidoreductase [Phycisphaerae bacterium]|nr:NAD(P)-dependent oxidoreductase [Phycisphaerae bacterium]
MNALENRRVALIGGAGFIGHNLALELVRLGCHVEIVDSLMVNNLLAMASGNPRSLPPEQLSQRGTYIQMLNERLDLLREAGVPLHTQDAREYDALSHTLNRINPDTIIHLAAVSHANVSNKDPHSTFDHSLRTLENALDNARSTCLSVKHFIYFSSSMVYGDFKDGVVTETTPCEPIGIYGALKFAGEKMVIAYNQVFGLPYTIIRPSALYGERCVSRRVGQVFIENALQGLPVTIQGDGSDFLDFTYIKDLTHGVIRAMQCEEAANQIFNITYGRSRSLKELIGVLRDHFPKLKVDTKDRDRLMPKRGTLCIDKAIALLDYNPRYPIERGFEQYVSWYKGRTHAVCAVG